MIEFRDGPPSELSTCRSEKGVLRYVGSTRIPRLEEPVPPTPTERAPIASSPDVLRAYERQRAGLRLIILYKFCKAALMFGIALWLTTAPGSAYRVLELVARDLAEGGAAFARAGHWISAHLSDHVVIRSAELAWLDSVTTGVEGVLLLSGKSWAQWIVIVGLACLIPFEILSFEHRPGLGKLAVLAVNALIVAYLARAQLQKAALARH